ncbi:MAG: polysaccharide pyruvyl transferase family protein [Nitrospirales bacterium]|nr:polysaccharide pyruvyl transferase family protein [Nitrospirales bacterium]
MTQDGAMLAGGSLRPVSLSHPKRVGIMGHVGNENLGDESIIAAVIQNIRDRWPDAEICGFTIMPVDTQKRHGIPSFPIRRGSVSVLPGSPTADFVATSDVTAAEPTSGSASGAQATNSLLTQRVKEIVKAIPILSTLMRGVMAALEVIPMIGKEFGFLVESRQRIKGLDLLLIAGSHQLNDFVDGPWAFPYTVLKWTLLARNAGAKVVFLSLGAGPIETWLGRRFLRYALQQASYRSYRDVTSKRWVDTLQGFDADQIVPDLAFSLRFSIRSPESDRSSRPLVVGINLLPFYGDYWFESDAEKYQAYVAKLAGFADWLVERGGEVRFIPTQLKVDPEVATDVINQMKTKSKTEYAKLIVEPTFQSLDDLLSALSELDIVVATRYHGILLSLALQKPVLAIAYHDKSRDLMKWFGLGNYVIEGKTFRVEELTDRFAALEKHSASITSSLREQMPKFKSSLQIQYDTVFNLIDG